MEWGNGWGFFFFLIFFFGGNSFFFLFKMISNFCQKNINGLKSVMSGTIVVLG